MRQVERIDIILKVLDIKQFLIDIGIPWREADKCDISVIDDWECFVDQWKLNADLRLTQALISFGHLPNIPGFWYYKEEDDYCIEKGLLKVEDVKFWGQNYDKNNKRLPETKYILLKDLTTDHIKGILKYFKDNLGRLPTTYKKYFEDRMKKVKLKKVVFTKKEIKQLKVLKSKVNKKKKNVKSKKLQKSK